MSGSKILNEAMCNLLEEHLQSMSSIRPFNDRITHLLNCLLRILDDVNQRFTMTNQDMDASM